MQWVYDMDGTLVETRRANYEAYRHIGVTPTTDHGIMPWQEWCTDEQHDKKNEVLPRFLAEHARLLPAWGILQATGGEILTNASQAAYEAVVAVFPLLGQYRATTGKRPDEKLVWLIERQEQASDPMNPGVYLDDHTLLVQELRRKTRWQVLDTSGF